MWKEWLGAWMKEMSMATYGYEWRLRTNPDGTGMIDGPGAEPRAPMQLTLDEEDVLELEEEIRELPAAEQDDRIKGFFARRGHECTEP
jgi:hypothetical protein